jgi:fimbrial chaperone protein
MISFILQSSLFLFFTMISLGVQATALQITPTRINLSHNTPVATLSLNNKSSTTSMLHIESMQWTQSAGHSVYTPTQDIIVSPPIMSIEPGKSQLIRIALRKNNAVISEEKSYRIFIQEIPKYRPENTPGVAFALRFGIPVFVLPTAAITHNLQWKLKSAHHHLQLEVMNTNNTHIQFTHLDLLEPTTHRSLVSEDVFVYLLPHQSKRWTYKITDLNKKIEVNARTDWGPVSAMVTKL